MSQVLENAAVGCRKGEEAAEILQAYIKTQPVMMQSHTIPAASPAPSTKPQR